MEDYVILLSIAMLGVFFLVGMNQYQARNKPKTKEKSAQEGLIKTYETNIDRLSKELNKQTSRASRLQTLRDGEEEQEATPTPTPEISGAKEATWDEIQELVKVSYPQYAKYLALPGIQDKVMEQVKGMTLAQIIQQIKSIIGGGQPQSGTPQTNEAYNPNFA